MKIQHVSFIVLTLTGLSFTHCGAAEYVVNDSENRSSSSDSSRNDTDSASAVKLNPASLSLKIIQTSAKASDVFAHITYSDADFAFVIRCQAAWTLRRANGMPARTTDGQLDSVTELESRAIWESAIETSAHCTSFGEKLIRASLSDPLAASGRYFYLLRPCKVPLADSLPESHSFLCSSNIQSTPDITLYNELSERERLVFKKILALENQIAGVALKFRARLSIALEAQLKCEQNTTVDAVREAKSKALKTVLSTSIAAAVGGAVAGPAAALAAAKQTLSWVTEYLGSGTRANPTKCTQLKDAQTQTELVAIELEALHEKVSQLKNELADLEVD